MKRVLYGITGLCFLLLLLAAGGCASPARIIGIDSDEALVTVSGIDPADWQRAAEENIRSLLASGALRRTDGQQPVVMISRIRNYTMMHLESQILTDKIRRAILPSGQAKVSSAVGVGGNIDLAVRRIRAKELDDLFDQSTVQKRGTVIAPNFSLSGAITQQTAYQGRTEESYFLFHMALTDLATGLAVWENTVEILKQGTYPLFY